MLIKKKYFSEEKNCKTVDEISFFIFWQDLIPHFLDDDVQFLPG